MVVLTTALQDEQITTDKEKSKPAHFRSDRDNYVGKSRFLNPHISGVIVITMWASLGF